MADLGADLSCVTDLDPAMVEVSGRTCLVQNAARRLSTPRGSLIDDPNYGFDLTGELNDDVDQGDIGRIQSQASAELLKDERVVSCTSVISFDATSGTLITTFAMQDGAGPFTLVLAVTSVTVTILKVIAR